MLYIITALFSAFLKWQTKKYSFHEKNKDGPLLLWDVDYLGRRLRGCLPIQWADDIKGTAGSKRFTEVNVYNKRCLFKNG